MRTVTLLQRQRIAPFAALCCMAVLSAAQVNVTTCHYDSARIGQNTAETVWTPARNSSQFGELFSVPLDDYVYAQPLYLANVNIAVRHITSCTLPMNTTAFTPSTPIARQCCGSKMLLIHPRNHLGTKR